MAPLTPYWTQPSHPDIQDVQIPSNPEDFTTKSVSKVELKPNAVFAKLEFPPCTAAGGPTYATVQMGKNAHLNLNSDLVYINHACEPSLIFDMAALAIRVGPNGLKVGEELTFFYPSTEWDMAQGFDCFCGAATCRGFISGAKNMTDLQLEGLWLNDHIRELLAEKRDGGVKNGGTKSSPIESSNGVVKTVSSQGNGCNGAQDATEEALKASLEQAKKMVDAAQYALDIYKSLHGEKGVVNGNGAAGHGVGSRELSGEMGGDTRHGVTSRELSGEMGGDTEGLTARSVAQV